MNTNYVLYNNYYNYTLYMTVHASNPDIMQLRTIIIVRMECIPLHGPLVCASQLYNCNHNSDQFVYNVEVHVALGRICLHLLVEYIIVRHCFGGVYGI